MPVVFSLSDRRVCDATCTCLEKYQPFWGWEKAHRCNFIPKPFPHSFLRLESKRRYDLTRIFCQYIWYQACKSNCIFVMYMFRSISTRGQTFSFSGQTGKATFSVCFFFSLHDWLRRSLLYNTFHFYCSVFICRVEFSQKSVYSAYQRSMAEVNFTVWGYLIKW